MCGQKGSGSLCPSPPHRAYPLTLASRLPSCPSQANEAPGFWNPGFPTSLVFSAPQSLSLYSRVPLLKHVIHCSKLPTLLPKWVQPSRTLPHTPPRP